MRIALAAFVLSGLLFAADEARVRELIAQLGADDAAKRDAATTELERLGSEDESGKVEELLEASCSTANAGVTARCTALLATLQAWKNAVLVHDPGESVAGGLPFPTTRAIDPTSGRTLWTGPSAELFWIGPRQRDVGAFFFAGTNLEARDLRTGRVRWTRDVLEHGRVVGDQYWLGFDETRAMRIDLADGRVAWETDLPRRVRGHLSPPTADAEGVFLPCRWGLMGLDAHTGEVRWRREGPQFDSPTLVGEALYVSADCGTQRFARRLDPMTKADVWERGMPAGWDPGQILACGTGDRVILYAGSTHHGHGWTIAYDAATGDALFDLGASCDRVWTEPDGEVIWAACGATLEVLDWKDGRLVSSLPLHGGEVQFAIEGNHLIVTDFDRSAREVEVMSINVADRAARWTTHIPGARGTDMDFMQTARTEVLPVGIVVIGTSISGSFVDVVDPETGRVTIDHRAPGK